MICLPRTINLKPVWSQEKLTSNSAVCRPCLHCSTVCNSIENTVFPTYNSFSAIRFFPEQIIIDKTAPIGVQ